MTLGKDEIRAALSDVVDEVLMLETSDEVGIDPRESVLQVLGRTIGEPYQRRAVEIAVEASERMAKAARASGGELNSEQITDALEFVTDNCVQAAISMVVTREIPRLSLLMELADRIGELTGDSTAQVLRAAVDNFVDREG